MPVAAHLLRVFFFVGDRLGTHPILGRQRRIAIANRFGADRVDRQLAVDQLVARLFDLLHALLQHRVVFKFQGAAALDADHMVMVVGIGRIEFVVFVPLGQFEFPQNPHAGHQFHGAVDRRKADVMPRLPQQLMQIFNTEVFALLEFLEGRENRFALGRHAPTFLIQFRFEGDGSNGHREARPDN
jgi:hypothetical protein